MTLPRAYVGGLVLSGHILEPSTVIVDGSRIADVLPPAAPVGELPRIDASGLTIAPGLVDTHVHGALGHNFMEGTTDAIEQIARSLAARGTTSFLAATASVPLPRLTDSLSKLAARAEADGADSGARMLGIHLEGPFISPLRSGAHRAENLLEPTAENISAVIDAADGRLRVCTIAPETRGGVDAIAQLVRAGVVASIGHTDADHGTTVRAIAAGATRATHLWNAMPPVHHRAPGVIPAVLADRRVRPELIADGVHVAPELLADHFSHPALAERLILVSDGADVSGLGDGNYTRWEGTPVEVRDGVARTLTGGIAGSTASLLDGVRTLVRAGVPLGRALHAASTAPAASLGLDGVGLIQRGAAADLILLNPHLELQEVVLRGRPLPPSSRHSHAGD
jgi:N-acetylglucosamine-6-phosphate deacetylase